MNYNDFYLTHFSKFKKVGRNEIQVLCPWHNDTQSSLSINLSTGQYYCHGCGEKGNHVTFAKRMGIEILTNDGTFHNSKPQSRKPMPLINPEIVKGYVSKLEKNQKASDYLINKRGLSSEVIKRYQLGFDGERITIPIKDKNGDFINIRFYKPNADPKMLSYKAGYGKARLFPFNQLENDMLIICEGELDALCLISKGFNALTTTNGAKTWRSTWNPLFKNKDIVVCYDNDAEGENGSERVASELKDVAKSVRTIIWNGQGLQDKEDVIDFFVKYKRTPEDYKNLIEKSKPIKIESSSPSFGSEYELEDNCLTKIEFKNSKSEKVKLCNFNLQLHTDKLIDDGLEQERWFEGTIKVDGNTKPFIIRGKDFANNGRLQETVSEQGGASCQFLQRYIPDIRLAIQKLSLIKEEKILKQFGWLDDETYISPSTIITKDGILPHSDLKVDLSMAENARYLDIKIINDETHRETLKHIVSDLLSLNDLSITYPTIGHTFAAPLIDFLSDSSRYILWLRGLTGRGKSFLARRVQQFFGNFEEKNFVSWASTMNFIQMVGFYFKDAVFLADDFKSGHIQDKRELIQKIQSYADNAGRGRLNPDSTTKQTRPIRGFMVSTGEDIPINEASTLARMLVIDFPKNEKNLEKGHRCLQNQKYYSGVMGRYIHWLLKSKRLEDIKRMEVEHQQYFYKDIAGQQNDSRISHNLAVNMVGFECFCDFISDTGDGIVRLLDAKTMLELHREILLQKRDQSLTLVKDEQASNIFLNTLIDLINSGRVTIQDIVSGEDTRNMVGFKKEGKAYIIPSLSFQEVQRVLRDSGNQLNFSMHEIGSQLVGDGVIIEHEPNRSTKIVWWNGKANRVLVFPAKVFGEDDE